MKLPLDRIKYIIKIRLKSMSILNEIGPGYLNLDFYPEDMYCMKP
jgi:hypothetical protein